MNFLSPLGLLGLIGIPILIIIYIIKSKYKEYTISSTYIWELSERFLTKKSKLSKISGILSLILQILTILILSLALAHPILKIPNKANNYMFIIDNSASMNINDRFDKAIENINTIVDDAADDSTFTIVIAGKDPISPIYHQTDKAKVKQALTNLKPSYISSALTNGMSLAQEYFDNDNSLKIYLFTDINYQYSNNVELVNLALNEDYNYVISSLEYEISESGTTFSGEVISYNMDATINLDLYLDDNFIQTEEITLTKDENTTFTITTDYLEFSNAKVVINQQDNLILDNEYLIYADSQFDTHKILLVSAKPFYFQTAFAQLGENQIIVKSSYSEKDTGYDLYIFDSINPTTLPLDGAIWLFNINNNISDSGFAVQGELSPNNGATLTPTNQSNNAIYQQLTKNLMGSRCAVGTFMHYSIYSSFTTIMEYNQYPMIFAGVNGNNNREVVFSFDLHKSNLPISLDYLILIRNMLNYSLPQICEQKTFMCGDDLIVNVLPNCSSIRINTPSSYSTYLSVEADTASYTLNELGTYTLEATINDVVKIYKIYVVFPEGEQNPINNVEEGIEINGERNNKSFDSTYDFQWIMFIILLIICLLEWEVYIYDQRQIR